jgi:hypothetical protein
MLRCVDGPVVLELERWSSMGLRNEICDACFLRDKGSQSPFLMSTGNEMHPGEVLASLRFLRTGLGPYI